MILFGGSPEALAQQAYQRDNFYQGAAENTRSAIMQTQLANLRNVLAQQSADQDARDKQDQINQARSDRQSQINQAQAFTANQNDLNRASRLADVQAQQSGADRQNEVDFRQAADQAKNGYITPDKDQIATLYPHFRKDQIEALYGLAGQAAIVKAQTAASNSDKAKNPPDLNSILLASGARGTPFEDKAKAVVMALRAPYEEDFTTAATAADTGNRLVHLKSTLADMAANPVPRPSPLRDLIPWPFRSGQEVPANQELTSRYPTPAGVDAQLAAFQASLPNTAVTGTTTAGYRSTVAPSWAPLAFAPQTATAPAAPQPVAGPTPISAPLVPARAQLAPAAPIPPAPAPGQRIVGQKYRSLKGTVGIWTGTGWTSVQ